MEGGDSQKLEVRAMAVSGDLLQTGDSSYCGVQALVVVAEVLQASDDGYRGPKNQGPAGFELLPRALNRSSFSGRVVTVSCVPAVSADDKPKQITKPAVLSVGMWGRMHKR